MFSVKQTFKSFESGSGGIATNIIGKSKHVSSLNLQVTKPGDIWLLTSIGPFMDSQLFTCMESFFYVSQKNGITVFFMRSVQDYWSSLISDFAK